jgi:hypothetical protein
MGEMSLNDFIQERGEAIKEIGRRTSEYSLKTVNVNGQLHTALYPDWKKKEAERKAAAD